MRLQRNRVCPCKSGKKYKKCCGIIWLFQQQCVEEAVNQYALTSIDQSTVEERTELVRHIMEDEDLTQRTIQFLLGGR